jgi:hypothetical protein
VQGIVNLNWGAANTRAWLLGLFVSLAVVCNASAKTTLNTSDPIWFFTTVANKMLLNTFGFGVTNIPVYSNGVFVYTPSVQRLLQLTANIYEASTTNFYPTVFRPIFEQDNLGNIFIIGYTNLSSESGPNTVSGAGDAQLALPYDVANLSSFPANTPIADANGYVNVYDVPWIIGAKKGFPNFNEFSMQDAVTITRLLQVTRPTTNSLPNGTNQAYLFGVTNSLGFEFWNSYTNAYINDPVQVVVNDQLFMQMLLTNAGTTTTMPVFGAPGFPDTYPLYAATNVIAWPGGSFVLPLTTNITVLPNSQYDFTYKQFDNVAYNQTPAFIPISSPLQLEQILLQATNRLQAFMLDGNHVIDYVNFSGPGSTRNLNSEFQNTNSYVSTDHGFIYTNLIWSTLPDKSGNQWGIDDQINIADYYYQFVDGTYWKDPYVDQEIDGFRRFMNPNNNTPIFPEPGTPLLYATNLSVQVPYSPTVVTYEYDTFQANDPLVHYLPSDLNYLGFDPNANSAVQSGVHQEPVNSINFPVLPDLGSVNARYQPWGVNPPAGVMLNGLPLSVLYYDMNPYNLEFKDPLVGQSDNWSFPTNKFPTVGWLGRVHRGTPWQTVYLKASNILNENSIGTNTWSIWTGNFANPVDAVNSVPVQDRLLFDVFTTAPNDNATRGQLSVNVAANPNDPVTGLAAWSALFSGVVALTNTTPNTTVMSASPTYHPPITYSWLTINPAGPAGMNSPLGQLVTNINYMRTTFYTNTTSAGGSFKHVGDILSVPALTEQSPFLNTSSPQITNGISDEMYEWLPQQTLSLLRVSSAPRYVIYCYGQTLKPAPDGVETGSTDFGMVTNYQVVAETATRAVVQFRQVVVTNSLVPLTLQTNYSTSIEQFNVLPSY